MQWAFDSLFGFIALFAYRLLLTPKLYLHEEGNCCRWPHSSPAVLARYGVALFLPPVQSSAVPRNPSADVDDPMAIISRALFARSDETDDSSHKTETSHESAQPHTESAQGDVPTNQPRHDSQHRNQGSGRKHPRPHGDQKAFHEALRENELTEQVQEYREKISKMTPTEYTQFKRAEMINMKKVTEEQRAKNEERERQEQAELARKKTRREKATERQKEIQSNEYRSIIEEERAMSRQSHQINVNKSTNQRPQHDTAELGYWERDQAATQKLSSLRKALKKLPNAPDVPWRDWDHPLRVQWHRNRHYAYMKRKTAKKKNRPVDPKYAKIPRGSERTMLRNIEADKAAVEGGQDANAVKQGRELGENAASSQDAKDAQRHKHRQRSKAYEERVKAEAENRPVDPQYAKLPRGPKIRGGTETEKAAARKERAKAYKERYKERVKAEAENRPVDPQYAKLPRRPKIRGGPGTERAAAEQERAAREVDRGHEPGRETASNLDTATAIPDSTASGTIQTRKKKSTPGRMGFFKPQQMERVPGHDSMQHDRLPTPHSQIVEQTAPRHERQTLEQILGYDPLRHDPLSTPQKNSVEELARMESRLGQTKGMQKPLAGYTILPNKNSKGAEGDTGQLDRLATLAGLLQREQNKQQPPSAPPESHGERKRLLPQSRDAITDLDRRQRQREHEPPKERMKHLPRPGQGDSMGGGSHQIVPHDGDSGPTNTSPPALQSVSAHDLSQVGGHPSILHTSGASMLHSQALGGTFGHESHQLSAQLPIQRNPRIREALPQELNGASGHDSHQPLAQMALQHSSGLTPQNQGEHLPLKLTPDPPQPSPARTSSADSDISAQNRRAMARMFGIAPPPRKPKRARPTDNPPPKPPNPGAVPPTERPPKRQALDATTRPVEPRPPGQRTPAQQPAHLTGVDPALVDPSLGTTPSSPATSTESYYRTYQELMGYDPRYSSGPGAGASTAAQEARRQRRAQEAAMGTGTGTTMQGPRPGLGSSEDEGSEEGNGGGGGDGKMRMGGRK